MFMPFCIRPMAHIENKTRLIIIKCNLFGTSDRENERIFIIMVVTTNNTSCLDVYKNVYHKGMFYSFISTNDEG